MEYWYHYESLPAELKFTENDIEKIWELKPKTKSQVKVFNKIYDTPRFQQAYGIDYAFSGNVATSLPIPTIFENYLEYFSNKYNFKFNMLLLNWYENGEHYIGMHSDNEKQMVENSPVETITLGETRKFKIQNKTTKEIETFHIKNNEFFVMGGTFQKTHKHGIPKEKNKSGRISITMRAFRT